MRKMNKFQTVIAWWLFDRAIMMAALKKIAAFSDGETVDGGFDDHHSANIARKALEDVGCELK